AGLDGALGPCVPFVDVQVGTADRGLFELDQHLVGAGTGHRDLFHPDALGGLALDQRLHGLGHYGDSPGKGRNYTGAGGSSPGSGPGTSTAGGPGSVGSSGTETSAPGGAQRGPVTFCG